jgi:flagellar hook-associated protein 3 FlgL
MDRPSSPDFWPQVRAVVAAAASATTAQGVAAAVDAWFASPTGYAAVAYTGGPALSPVTVAEGETVPLDATAADAAVRDTLKGLALAAMLDRGTLGGNAAQRAELAKTAGAVLLEAVVSILDQVWCIRAI